MANETLENIIICCGTFWCCCYCCCIGIIYCGWYYVCFGWLCCPDKKAGSRCCPRKKEEVYVGNDSYGNMSTLQIRDNAAFEMEQHPDILETKVDVDEEANSYIIATGDAITLDMDKDTPTPQNGLNKNPPDPAINSETNSVEEDQSKEEVTAETSFQTLLIPEYITTLTEDDPAVYRIKMPCGHMYSIEAITNLVLAVVENNGFLFKCVAETEADGSKKCGLVWDYVMVMHALCLKDVQTETMEKLGYVYQVYGRDAKQCPKCRKACARDDRTVLRFRCTRCSEEDKSPDFCWACLQEWRSDDSSHCGNSDCCGKDPRTEYLKQCGSTSWTTGDLTQTCPRSRACPSCGFIHICDTSKHKRCYACKCTFCFVCLRTEVDGEMQCGTDEHIGCSLAPVQQR